MARIFKVSTQGMNYDFTTANGSFDVIELGEKSRKEISDLIERMVSLDTTQLSGDYCVPSIYCDDNSNNRISFYSENNKLYNVDTATEISTEAAIQLVFGEIKLNIREELKKEKESRGVKPFFKQEVLPTDRDYIKAENINIGLSSPQFSLRVWKSSGWKQFVYAFPISIGVFLILIGLIVAGEKRESDLEFVPYFMFGGIGFMFLIFPLKIFGKAIFKMGFDWTTNTLWVSRSNKGITGFEIDANYIHSFSYMNSSTSRFNYYWLSNSNQPIIYRNINWSITVKKVTSEADFGVHGAQLATKSEAKKVANLANAMLSSQM